MSPKVRAVYIKELRDSLRDRRTLFATLLVPLVLYPVMLLGVGEVSQIARTRLKKDTCAIGVPPGSAAFFEKLKIQTLDDSTLADLPGFAPLNSIRNMDDDGPDKNPDGTAEKENPLAQLNFIELPADEADKKLRDGLLQAAVVLSPDFEAQIQQRKVVELEVKYDQAEARSREARGRLEQLFERYKKTIVHERLKGQSLDTRFLHPFVMKSENVAHAQKVGGSIIGVFLPLLFIMMIIAGAMHVAIDMTAGEKERSTLETLIAAPVRPIEIMAGKFLAVATLALGSAALNVGSFGISFMLMPMPKGLGFEFPWSALPLTLLVLLPLALFFSALLLAVCSLAANPKEAQVYCLPIYLMPVMGMMPLMMPGIELEGPLLIAPVLNAALLIKQLFLGHGTAQQVVFVFLSTCFYAAFAVSMGARLFAREEVLFSAQSSFRLFLSRKFIKPGTIPKPGDALLLVALLFPLNFYVQVTLGKMLYDPAQGEIPLRNLALMVLLPLYLVFLVLPMIAAWYLKLDLKQTFLWKRPSLRAVIGAALLGCGSWLIASQMAHWQSLFWQFSSGEGDPLSKSIETIAKMEWGTAILIFMIGVTPAICEEHFFRGFLQQGLTRSGKWLTLITVGLLFGAFHFPMFRQPIVGTLGIAIAFVAFESRSLWPSVIFHFLHNSLSIVGPTLIGLPQSPPENGRLPAVPLEFLLPAVALFVTGLVLVRNKSAAPMAAAIAMPVAPPLAAAPVSEQH